MNWVSLTEENILRVSVKNLEKMVQSLESKL
jgi:hypothetical protein